MKNDINKNDDLFNTYVMYELVYEEMLKDKLNSNIRYPNCWYKISNYNIKIQILKEAINKNKNIMEIDGYNDLLDDMLEQLKSI